jgi:hypothetical protein
MNKLKLRILLSTTLCLAGIFFALNGAGVYFDSFKAQAQSVPGSAPRASLPGAPDVVRLTGPVVSNTNLRDLPYIPPAPQIPEERLTRYPHSERSARSQSSGFLKFQSLFEKIVRPVPSMPAPLLTFEGINFTQTQCAFCWPPDTNGDVGPNHYVQSVNTSFRVFDKSGNPLSPVTTFNSFFAPLGQGTPCGSNQNHGDPFVSYDHIADRWVITDIALVSLPGNSFWECIGVSQTGDPTGSYYLYALQHDPANPNRYGDYPKFALWPDAYYLTMNEFTELTPQGFVGVRVYALDRASMISGGPTNAIGFTIGLVGVGNSYSLVPASFRTGSAPPAGEHEFLLAVDATFPGVTLTQVHGWYFHVDFITPANSTLGLGIEHTPNAEITVNPFVQAWTDTDSDALVPQQGTSRKLATVGDKIMTPVVYQNHNGTESLWAAQTTMLNFPNGPTAVSWYQFDVNGGNFSADPVQQQEWTNDDDGLWRWMPSIAVDQNGNVAIGYSTSSPSIYAGIRYAGRLSSDPLNNLGQGEAEMTNGSGAQLTSYSRWGDYTMTTIDPIDSITFWHTNEYYQTTGDHNWFTRVGKFQFRSASPTPTPTPIVTPTPTLTPSPTATATPSATATATPTPTTTATPTATATATITPRPTPPPRPRPTPRPRP